VDLGKYYAILPTGGSYTAESYCATNNAKPVPQGFCYNSGTNEQFLTVKELRTLINQDVDSSV
jgi:hypothetical protein